MPDRSPSPAPDPDHSPGADPSADPESPDAQPDGGRSGTRLTRALAGSERSLDRRWWWSAAVQAIVGIAVIGFQWEVIADGEAIWATWVMVVIGAGLIVAGGITAWRDRPQDDQT